MTDFYLKLNQQQKRAVAFGEGPCMVYSGPGSGKTTIIAHRVKYLIEEGGIAPSKILVITFTKAAAEEMKKRYESIATQGRGGEVVFGTFHSIFFKIIRGYYNYNLSDILQETDKYKVIKNILKTLRLENHLDEDLVRDIILDLSRNKCSYNNNGIMEGSSVSREALETISNCYENYKRDCKKIDFDDMITKCFQLLQKEPAALNKLRRQHQYILIDEFQDINQLQFEIIRMITHPLNNLFVVGDDDQAIYSFRGSSPEFIVNFEKLYPAAEKIFVNKNYRSQGRLIEAANGLINNNKIRIHKEMEVVNPAAAPISYQNPDNRHKEKAKVVLIIEDCIKRGYSYGDIAIIYRTNLQASSLADYLLNKEIPFYSNDKLESISDHWIARDIFAYLKAAANINDYNSILSIINRPSRYISNKAIEAAGSNHKDLLTSLKVKGNLMAYQVRLIDKLQVEFKNLNQLSLDEGINYIRKTIGYDQYIEGYCKDKEIASDGYFDILDELEDISKNYKDFPSLIKGMQSLKKNQTQKTEAEGITLQTIHSAKGLEYKIVIIVGAVEEVVPHKRTMDSIELLEEERRLFYVAVTRAKDELYVLSPKYWYNQKALPSRFVAEMKNNAAAVKYLAKGKEIIHRIFGRGRVLEENEGSIRVDFENSGVKELDIEICMKNNIIQ